MQTVIRYCQNGWPRTQRNVPVDARKYWRIRDTLHYSNGVVFTNYRIVVPSTLQSNMLDLIHENYFGIEKRKARACELLIWPRMSQQIESLISNCNVCCKFQNKHQREPMISHEMPNERFYKVGADIMTFKSIDYLVVVDYFAKFPEMLFA